DRRACGVDVSRLVVEPRRHFGAARTKTEPVEEPIVEVKPIDGRPIVAERAAVLREELDAYTKLVAGKHREVQPHLGELEAASLRAHEKLVVRRVDEALAREAVELDARLGERALGSRRARRDERQEQQRTREALAETSASPSWGPFATPFQAGSLKQVPPQPSSFAFRNVTTEHKARSNHTSLPGRPSHGALLGRPSDGTRSPAISAPQGSRAQAARLDVPRRRPCLVGRARQKIGRASCRDR